MSDLVKRLREGAELAETMPKPDWFLKAICPQAADRIEELEEALESMQERVEDLEKTIDAIGPPPTDSDVRPA